MIIDHRVQIQRNHFFNFDKQNMTKSDDAILQKERANVKRAKKACIDAASRLHPNKNGGYHSAHNIFRRVFEQARRSADAHYDKYQFGELSQSYFKLVSELHKHSANMGNCSKMLEQQDEIDDEFKL